MAKPSPVPMSAMSANTNADEAPPASHGSAIAARHTDAMPTTVEMRAPQRISTRAATMEASTQVR